MENKRRKTNMKRVSFITQFKIEFLLPFTGCRNVLGKIPGTSFLGHYMENINKLHI